MELFKRHEIGGKSCWHYRVEFVDELVQVVGRLHDRAKQGHESHVVALEVDSHLCDICVTSTSYKQWIANLCVELRPEPARLQHRQAMGKSANLQNISKSGLTIKCCRLYEYARFCTCLMIS